MNYQILIIAFIYFVEFIFTEQKRVKELPIAIYDEVLSISDYQALYILILFKATNHSTEE